MSKMHFHYIVPGDDPGGRGLQQREEKAEAAGL